MGNCRCIRVGFSAARSVSLRHQYSMSRETNQMAQKIATSTPQCCATRVPPESAKMNVVAPQMPMYTIGIALPFGRSVKLNSIALHKMKIAMPMPPSHASPSPMRHSSRKSSPRMRHGSAKDTTICVAKRTRAFSSQTCRAISEIEVIKNSHSILSSGRRVGKPSNPKLPTM